TAGDTSQFALSNTTSSPVAAGGSTSFKIRFDPSTVGGKSATVTVSSDAPVPKNLYTFTVTGTGSFAPKVYWTGRDNGIVMKANLNGSNPETVFSGLYDPTGLAIDQSNNYMYIGECYGNSILKAPLDGSTSPTTISTGGGGPYGVAVDAVNGKVYWASFLGPYNLYSANLDGSGIFGIPSGALPFGIAVNPYTSDLFWSDYSYGLIFRTDKSLASGSGAPFMGGGGYGAAGGLAIDSTNNYLYWVEQAMGQVCRMDISNPVRQVIAGGGSPDSIAVDPADGWVFWGNHYSQLWRSNLDGSNAMMISGGGGRIYGIALDLVD
ncbi:MAG: hypothetical protein NTU91_09975, partial [Chloroflexi bacterium]|nr:hypothetical protein [Chloroflexota bacterium]